MKKKAIYLAFLFLITTPVEAHAFESVSFAFAIEGQICRLENSAFKDCDREIFLASQATTIQLNQCEETEVTRLCTGVWSYSFERNGHRIDTKLRLTHYEIPRSNYEISVVQQDPVQIRRTRRLTEIQLGGNPLLKSALEITGRDIPVDENGTALIPELRISSF